MKSSYPNFLYIGVSKAGSSWIYEILREHPEVFVPPAKDLQFFDRYYEKGIDWYLSFFQPGENKKAIGEVAHDYFLNERTARRIKKHLPDVRMFCCLRDPIDQIYSTFIYRKNVVLDSDTTIEEFAFREEVLHLCDYYYNLLPFYELFPEKNLLVLFFDELKEDSALFARKIFDFINVTPDFEPSILHRKVLPASEPRLSKLGHFAYGTGTFLRRLGFPNVVGAVKTSSIFRALLYKPLKKKTDMPAEVKKQLKAYYKERYEKLPQLIGQPLPGEWQLENC